MAEPSLGQVAYEQYVQAFGTAPRPKPPWESLRPPVRARWETIATAVLEACGGTS